MKIKKEIDVEKYIDDLCNKHNFIGYNIQGKSSSDNGVPDKLIIDCSGTSHFLEVKYKHKLSIQQKLFLKRVNHSYQAKYDDKKGKVYLTSLEQKGFKLELEDYLINTNILIKMREK